MLRKSFAMLALGIVLAVAVSRAQAANVTYTLVIDPTAAANGCVGCTLGGVGTWDLYASASLGDNFGIASYKASLSGTTSIFHRAPRTTLTPEPNPGELEPGSAGFTLLRSGNNISPIVATQDTVGPTPYIIKGFGQEAASFIGEYPGTVTSGTSNQATPEGWAQKFLLAEGAYTGTLPSFNLADLSASNIFTEATGVATTAANILTEICTGVCGGGVLPVVDDLALTQTTLGQVVAGNVPLQNVITLSLNNAAAPIFTPLLAGKPLILNTPPTITNAGAFSWNTAGALRGTYEWALTGVNGANNDAGKVVVTVTAVPEPGTLALFGLAIAGVVGVARRRS